MNIRRGLFRFWIVISALWAILVGVVTGSEIISPYMPPQTYVAKNIFAGLIPEASEAFVQHPSGTAFFSLSDTHYRIDLPQNIKLMVPKPERRKDKEPSTSELKVVTDPALIERLNALKFESDAKIKNDASPAPEIELLLQAIRNDFSTRFAGRRDEEIRTARMGNAAMSAFAIVTPPIAVLVLGAILVWVFSGFRKDDGNVKL